MKFLLLILALAVSTAAYMLAADYVRRSKRSFENAERMFVEVNRISDEIMDADVPQSVARFIVLLVASAGCGCFVRGMLVSHYLPRFTVGQPASNGPIAVAMDDIDRLTPELRQTVWRLISAVVVYDSFRNPLQGWLFRRILKSFQGPASQVSVATRLETWQTAATVLARKKPTLVSA